LAARTTSLISLQPNPALLGLGLLLLVLVLR